MSKTQKLTVIVEDIALGPVMRQLHGTDGIVKIVHDLGEPKTNGVRAPQKKFPDKAEEFIIDLMVKSAPIPTKVLRQHFADVGRRPGSTSSALNLLKTEGLIKHDENNAWVFTKKMKDRLRHRNSGKKK